MANPMLVLYEAKNPKGRVLGWKFKMESDTGEVEYISVGLFDTLAEATEVCAKVNTQMFHGELPVVVP